MTVIKICKALDNIHLCTYNMSTYIVLLLLLLLLLLYPIFFSSHMSMKSSLAFITFITFICFYVMFFFVVVLVQMTSNLNLYLSCLLWLACLVCLMLSKNFSFLYSSNSFNKQKRLLDECLPTSMCTLMNDSLKLKRKEKKKRIFSKGKTIFFHLIRIWIKFLLPL